MIYFVRHGLDDERYVGGHSDIGLVKEGIEEIKKIGSFLVEEHLPINKIYVSDVKRAKESAEIINNYLHLEIIEDKSLRELDKGDITGKLKSSLSENERYYLKSKDKMLKFPNGESMQDLYDRINNLYKSNYFLDKDNSLIVTHRGVINMLYFILNNDPLIMKKKKYNVEHASLHELDLNIQKIKRIK